MKITLLSVGLLVVSALSLVAQDTVGGDLKSAGSSTKKAAVKATSATKKGAVKATSATKNGVKKGTHKAASATEKGASSLKQKTSDTSTH